MPDVLRMKQLRCPATLHAFVSEDGRYLRERCTDRRCPDVKIARENGDRAYHVWDLHTREIVRTEFEPAE